MQFALPVVAQHNGKKKTKKNLNTVRFNTFNYFNTLLVFEPLVDKLMLLTVYVQERVYEPEYGTNLTKKAFYPIFVITTCSCVNCDVCNYNMMRFFYR